MSIYGERGFSTYGKPQKKPAFPGEERPIDLGAAQTRAIALENAVRFVDVAFPFEPERESEDVAFGLMLLELCGHEADGEVVDEEAVRGPDDRRLGHGEVNSEVGAPIGNYPTSLVTEVVNIALLLFLPTECTVLRPVNRNSRIVSSRS